MNEIYTEFYSGAELSFIKAMESARVKFAAAANYMLNDRGMIIHSWQMNSVFDPSNGIYQSFIVALYIPKGKTP